MAPRRKVGNAVFGLALGAVVLGMFSFSYANVPLFKLFCERFGIVGSGKARGPAMVSSSTGAILDRDIQVKFMGVAASGLPVRFGPSEPLVHVVPGRPIQLSYTFTNMSEDSVFFRAVHSIAPPKAAREFQLLQCFCFEDQALGPRETRVLPVYFALTPRLPQDVQEIQLSYTLFPRDPNDLLPATAKQVN